MENLHTYLNAESKQGFALCYENNQVVEKFASEHGMDLFLAKMYFMELKKFLFLCSISEERLAPSKEIDKIWHSFILFTKDYRFYCINFLGRFIDHIPDTGKTKPEGNYLANTLNKYDEIFGFIEDRVWKVIPEQKNHYYPDYEAPCGAGDESSSSCTFSGNCFDCTSSGKDLGENPNDL